MRKGAELGASRCAKDNEFVVVGNDGKGKARGNLVGSWKREAVLAKGLKEAARREKASRISVCWFCNVGIGIVLQETVKTCACVGSETISSEALQPT